MYYAKFRFEVESYSKLVISELQSVLVELFLVTGKSYFKLILSKLILSKFSCSKLDRSKFSRTKWGCSKFSCSKFSRWILLSEPVFRCHTMIMTCSLSWLNIFWIFQTVLTLFHSYAVLVLKWLVRQAKNGIKSGSHYSYSWCPLDFYLNKSCAATILWFAMAHTQKFNSSIQEK